MKIEILLLAIIMLVQTAIVPSSYEYIIVGAGFAGLGACTTLTSKGVPASNILIIEAKNRTGGRCTTFNYGGTIQDLGAAFIHNPSPSNSLHKLASNISAFTKVPAWFGNQTQWYVNRTKVSAASLTAAETLYKSFAKSLDKAFNNDTDTDLASVLASFWKSNPIAKQYPKNKVNQVLQLWAIQNGGELSDMSVWEYQIYFNFAGNTDYKLNTTLSEFHTYLWNRGCKATLNLGEKVIGVDYSGTKTVVTTDKATYSTYKLMLSPSLGILKASLAGTSSKASIISFNPTLPAAKKNAINKIGFGRYEKLFVTFNQTFWDSNSSTLQFTCNGTATCIFTEGWVVPKVQNTMLFWIGGNAATYLTSRTTAQIKAELQTFLTSFLNPVPAITNLYMTNWTNDPNVLGGYSYATVGITDTTFNDLRKVLKSGSKNIWFIGEGTHNIEYSYAYGAYDSGVDAATAAFKI